MNKVVREHYPAANLPEGFDSGAIVRIVIEAEARSPFAYVDETSPATLDEMLRKRERDPSAHSGSLTMDEAVSVVRELRDQDE